MATSCLCRQAVALSDNQPRWVGEIRSVLAKVNSRVGSQPSSDSSKWFGKVTSEKLYAEKRLHGAFSSLEEVYSIPRIGKRVCRALLDEESLLKYEECIQKASCLSKGFSSTQRKFCFPDLVSIDLGPKNASWVWLKCNLEVVEWKRVTTEFPDPYAIELGYNAMRDFAACLPNASAFVLEGQSHRVMNNGGFMKIGLQLRLQEALLYSTLKCGSDSVFTLQPKVVQGIYKFKSKSGKEKKKMAVSIVHDLLSQQNFVEDFCPSLTGKNLKIASTLVDMFANEKKQDDLSDCLLQGIAFYDSVMSSFLLQHSRSLKSNQ